MNGRARTAKAIPIGLLLLSLGVPGAFAADTPPAAGAGAKAACPVQQVEPAEASLGPATAPKMSPEAKLLPDTPTAPDAFACDPSYRPYDAKAELAIYQGKHLNETANPPVVLGLRLYDRGAYAPRPTLLGQKDPVQFHFMAYGDLRTAVADNDNGKPAANGKTYQSQVATRLNLDLDLNLTPTERIHAFMRPFDKTTAFTRFDLDGAVRDKFVPELNTKLVTLFFEGDLGNMLAGLTGKLRSFDIPIAGGLVPIFTQNGIWIQDAFKGAAIGITAKHSKDLDISNMDLTFFTGLDNVTSDAFGVGHGAGKIYGLAGFADLLKGYMEAGYGYVEADDKDLSYNNVTLAFTTRFEGNVSNSVRLIGNFGQKAAVKTANGLLVLVESSLVSPDPWVLVPYLNLFAGFDTPQSLARAADAGGVLGNTGINFQTDGLTGFPTLDFHGHDTYGGAGGVEYLFNLNRSVIFEGAAVEPMRSNPLGAEYAFGASFQQPLNNAWILRFDGMRGWLEKQRDIFGVRMELRRKF
ncbi:MAG TPA: hypothetical protein VJA16_00505 [Thermoanaerobaculia bacterium]